MLRRMRAATGLILLGFSLSFFPSPVCARDEPAAQEFSGILQYISSGWNLLRRSMESCKTFEDPKTGEKSFLYLPSSFPLPSPVAQLEETCSLRVLDLPKPITVIGPFDISLIHPGGLLYLPHPYVVPGGMFNEMYGWDSYFIIRGLVKDGQVDLAEGMVENFFFEIDHYGGVLNANRGYYLTRSQPPFLTSMILAVYDAEKAKRDRAWLARAYHFEQAGGLVTSTQQTGAQWDYPYGWAPLQLIAVEGLRHFGYSQDADRLSREFLSMVRDDFRRDGNIREKYNVVTRSSETHIQAGYTANVIGFGWTNGVFVTLFDELTAKSASIQK